MRKRELYAIAVDEAVKSGQSKSEAIMNVSLNAGVSYATVERCLRRESKKRRKSKSDATVVGIISDTHIPYELEGYLQFCIDTFKREGVNRVVHIGDGIDHHAMSFHDSEPSLKGVNGERIDAIERLQPWFDAFPELTYIRGNHCKIPARQLTKLGMDPNVYMRPLGAVYNFPKGWKEEDRIIIDNVMYHHGETAGGVNGFRNDAKDRMMNTVSGHNHSNLGISYTACDHRMVWGMAVGCGVDASHMAFAYGKNFKRKPTVGCGVVKENGTMPMVFAMPLGEKW
jgi:predicted phosphodiesterase